MLNLKCDHPEGETHMCCGAKSQQVGVKMNLNLSMQPSLALGRSEVHVVATDCV